MKVQFILPKKGVFQPNNIINDPLHYYYNPITGILYKQRIQQGLSMLNGKYSNVLEFGYGSGLLLPSLAAIAENLYGIDIESEPSVVNNSLNKLSLKASLIKNDITKANYPQSYFNLIVGFSVFEHIAEPDSVLQEMYRILKPGGKLLVGMPRVDKTMEKLFIMIGFNNINDHHVKNYKTFLIDASKYFNLEKFKWVPSFFPNFTGLYFNMLLTKK
jgi:ubiquinone/menaquinone biosynthesis C-methylase UbiE